MSHRPTDWAPLAETDPLPGDPDAIFDEAFRLRNMAAGITDQVNRLRRIGADDSLVGASFGELRASALELSGKLEKVAARYAKVSGLLTSWAPELEDFQAATLKALDKALEAERQRARDPHADLANPGVFAYQVFHATGLGDDAPTGADTLLTEARTDLRRVLDEAAARDRHWAHQIGQAIDDDLTDGFFDHMHQWVERNNKWIENLTDKLGWVTTGAALAALLIPGVGEVVAGVELVEVAEAAETLGQVSAGVTFAAHTVQVAGGDKGARFDLGLDIFALGSLGAAKALTRSLGHTAEATREAAAAVAERETAQGIEAASKSATQGTDILESRSARAADLETAQVLVAPEAKVGIFRVLLAGDSEAADAAAEIETLRAQYGHDAIVKGLTDRGRRLANTGRANFWTATGFDVVDKTGSHTRLKDSYGGFKRWVATGGPLR